MHNLVLILGLILAPPSQPTRPCTRYLGTSILEFKVDGSFVVHNPSLPAKQISQPELDRLKEMPLCQADGEPASPKAPRELRPQHIGPR